MRSSMISLILLVFIGGSFLAITAHELECKKWPEVQKDLHNTVVQIFSEKVGFNWREPYKAGASMASAGSGFLVNEHGSILTNFHVVDEAKRVSIQIPSFGKRRFTVKIKTILPEVDLALLEVLPEDIDEIKNVLGGVPVLSLGDSDKVHRSEEVIAIGYPLGQESLKSTIGIVSGREYIAGQHMIQISAPINPGSSGGPVINCHGQVIGVCTCMNNDAQNVNYIIASKQVKLFLARTAKGVGDDIRLLRRPLLGGVGIIGSSHLTTFLSNPLPGGYYLRRIEPGGLLDKAGIQPGDMIYSINDNPVDLYGTMNVPWSEDKIPVDAYVSDCTVDEDLRFQVYRHGKELQINSTIEENELLPVRTMYPCCEAIDYEVIGGMVIMPLSYNLLNDGLGGRSDVFGAYVSDQDLVEGLLIVTHVLPSSVCLESRMLVAGDIVDEINGVAVKILSDLRTAVAESFDTNLLVIKTAINELIVLPFDTILEEEPMLSDMFSYPMNELVKSYYEQKLLSDNIPSEEDIVLGEGVGGEAVEDTVKESEEVIFAEVQKELAVGQQVEEIFA